MKNNSKIFSLDKLLAQANTLKSEGKKIVLCHGHFNVIHPGHLRFLNFSKKQGDLLVVSISQENSEDYYTQEERAIGVASLEMVDAVYILDVPITDFIHQIKPSFYIKGREFERGTVQDDVKAVEKNNGKVIFSFGDIEYSTLKLSNSQNYFKSICQKKETFLRTCSKQDISLNKLQHCIDDFNKLNILVIGDTIVDQFVSCDTLGVSSEAPVLAIRELESKEFIGGAAIIAQHIKSLGANCTFVSLIGDDSTGAFVQRSLLESEIKTELIIDPSRPTTFKIRYMVDNQKLLRVSRLQQHEMSADLETRVLNYLDNIENYHGIIISDFVYGVITPKIIDKIFDISKTKNIKVFGDVQCSSQMGDVTKFKNIELITPTEKEARIGLGDQNSSLEVLAHKLIKVTNNNNVVITLGSQGILAYTTNNHADIHSEYFPALETPVDVAGAGDSVMSGYALGICHGLNLMEATAFASCLAGISVSRIGNIPIKVDEIKQYLQEMMNLPTSNEE